MPKPDNIKQRAAYKLDEADSDMDEKNSEDAIKEEDSSSQDDEAHQQDDSDDDDDDDNDESDDAKHEDDDNDSQINENSRRGRNQQQNQQQSQDDDNDEDDSHDDHNIQQQQGHNMQGNQGGGGAHGGNDDRSSATNLIINYLPQDMTDRELYTLFSGCGSINTCKIMRDYKTGYSFGYGFVDYSAEADSEEAIRKLNGFYVRNKRLKVSYARPGGQSIKDTNLYVINLSRNINDDQLDRIFSPFGLIVQRNILRDKLTGRPRGVAFVRYNKREEAQEAIKALNNTVPEGGSQPIWVRLAEEHGKAKAAQFMQIGPPHMGQQQQPPHHLNHPHMQQAHHQHGQQQIHHHHHQQQQQHQQQHHQQQQHHHHIHHNLPPPHHMQQLHHHPHGGGGGIGVGVGVGLPPAMHGGGGGGGGYHHTMAHRAASHR